MLITPNRYCLAPVRNQAVQPVQDIIDTTVGNGNHQQTQKHQRDQPTNDRDGQGAQKLDHPPPLSSVRVDHVK